MGSWNEAFVVGNSSAIDKSSSSEESNENWFHFIFLPITKGAICSKSTILRSTQDQLRNKIFINIFSSKYSHELNGKELPSRK
jgi:hypothetical protein